MEQTLAPSVVESNVPERTRRRGEYSDESLEGDNGLFFAPSPLQQEEQTILDFQGG